MQIKIGSCPRATPDFLIYRPCNCSRAGCGAAGASGTRLGYRRREGPASVGARQAGPDGCAGLLGPPAAEGFDTMPAPLVRTFRPPAHGRGCRRLR